jgi:cytochrome b pre-mRNA-processing protein 3
MLRFLFPRLTADEQRGRALFEAAVAESRREVWYTDLGVPDTLDGRFSVLATVVALATVRLERGGAQARNATVGLAERFIESMDVEHRQIGYGDPTIGKIVRKLTGSLARRVERFREATTGDAPWREVVEASLKSMDDASGSKSGPAALEVRLLWERLQGQSDDQVIEGSWA